uniref:Uncharacterized protein n=1 Tax=Callorhinchus milii TaxID=7868 RepID=A0A4W3H767_CALMI
VIPVAVVHFPLSGFGFDGARSHVQQEVQVPVHHFDGKKVHLDDPGVLGVLLVARFPVTEQDQPVGLGGSKIERDGACLLGVPLRQSHV